MIHTQSDMARKWLRLAGAAASIALLAGCATDRTYDRTGYPPKIDLSAKAIGAIVIDENGNVAIVGAESTVPKRCSLPPRDDEHAKGGGTYPVCGKLEATRVYGIQSLSLISHTGSSCFTIGPFGHGSNAYYYQLPAGCTP